MQILGGTPQPVTPCKDTGIEPASLAGIQETQQENKERKELGNSRSGNVECSLCRLWLLEVLGV